MAKKELIKDSFEFNSKEKVKRKKNLLSELDELDEEEICLPSAIFNKRKEKKKESKVDKDEQKESELDDDWLNTITSFKTPKINKAKRKTFTGFDFDDDGKKVKKKKKKKDGELINHKKDFEPEMALLRNLQMDQTKFVDSLQKKYDQLENTKSSARGVGKFTTDLINSITTARSVSMQLVDKIISTKKTIADLDFKERKEFGSNTNSEHQNLSNYASTYLKQVMTSGRNNLVAQNNTYDNNSYDEDDNIDDLFDSISDSLGETDRSEDVEKYLKYENDNVEIVVKYYDDADENDLDNKYQFIAYNGDGEVIDDYPLPEKTKLSINRATGIATDKYGSKYKMEII